MKYILPKDIQIGYEIVYTVDHNGYMSVTHFIVEKIEEAEINDRPCYMLYGHCFEDTSSNISRGSRPVFIDNPHKVVLLLNKD